jgi:hypothetical protein
MFTFEQWIGHRSSVRHRARVAKAGILALVWPPHGAEQRQGAEPQAASPLSTAPLSTAPLSGRPPVRAAAATSLAQPGRICLVHRAGRTAGAQRRGYVENAGHADAVLPVYGWLTRSVAGGCP